MRLTLLRLAAPWLGAPVRHARAGNEGARGSDTTPDKDRFSYRDIRLRRNHLAARQCNRMSQKALQLVYSHERCDPALCPSEHTCSSRELSFPSGRVPLPALTMVEEVLLCSLDSTPSPLQAEPPQQHPMGHKRDHSFGGIGAVWGLFRV